MPGEEGLLEGVDALVDATLDGNPAELDEHGAGRCVDKVAAQRNLDNRPITLGDADEARRVGPTEFVQPDPIGVFDLSRVGDELDVAAAPCERSLPAESASADPAR